MQFDIHDAVGGMRGSLVGAIKSILLRTDSCSHIFTCRVVSMIRYTSTSTANPQNSANPTSS